ncbi:DNA polymerase I [Jatrophihabitans endophyticus]|uniref:DNA polymerase I n=1 Tax=Jatrophihabitans endophyticus TaxID=1206085 RepID=A0A1M5CYB6_9ACTN|nr:DNA polymerase I [Jatrophihabitans endophyticus]SHF59716.1 DNA polymerase I [Jatrophihabitans endophyticus]
MTASTATSTGAQTATVLLLDGHSLAYRAFYALREVEMSTTTGQPTNAVFGFTSMLINLMRDEQPTHVAVAFDVSRKTFRAEMYADYKAGRSETPDDFRGQVTLIREVLDALRIPTLMVDGYEADDVIATLTTQATAQGADVLICTGDRDALQLVNDHVTVLYPKRGVSEMTRFTPDEVRAKYNLEPVQYPDFAALRGDPSDNLPNIPSVGEKTAAKWIREYGSLNELIEQVDTVKGKVGDALREHVGSVMLNRRLTELVRDVALDVDLAGGLDPLARQQWDRDEVHKLFDDLQFRVLRERLFDSVAAAAPEADEGFDVAFVRLGVDEVAPWLDEHARDGRRVGVSFRGSWGRGIGSLTGIGLAAGDGDAAYVDPAALSPGDDQALGAWLADATVPKAVHDVKGPLLALRQHGWQLAGVTSDTQLAAYLLRPDTRAFDLADLALRYLRRELRSNVENDSGQLTLDGGVDESDDALAEVETVRATAVRDLADAFGDQLAEAGRAANLLVDMELPLAHVLADMEAVGIAADPGALVDLQQELGDGVKDVEAQAHELVGREFNLGSPKQLQEILFDQFQLPKTKRNKTGYTTDADALQDLYVKTEHPVLALLLKHREVARLKSVVDGLIPLIDDHGRIHTTFNQTIAATGRLSSTDPNLQNIPVRTAEGRRIRETFVVGEGYETLMTADYSQIEMRIMAHLSHDDGLIEAFTTGEDLHTFVASRAFDLPVDQIDPELRRRVKAMSYGLAYGLSAFGLARQLKIGTDEARGQMEAYFTRFGGVRDYLRSVVDVARQDGYTETIMGRRRYLTNLNSTNRNLREMAERAALNAPIQGSAADIIKIAMLGVHRALAEGDFGSRLLLQVHDELVLEIAPGERAAVEALVRREMAGAIDLGDVAMDVSVGVGRTWHDAAH